jgi:hypothetical protein
MFGKKNNGELVKVAFENFCKKSSANDNDFTKSNLIKFVEIGLKINFMETISFNFEWSSF